MVSRKETVVIVYIHRCDNKRLAIGSCFKESRNIKKGVWSLIRLIQPFLEHAKLPLLPPSFLTPPFLVLPDLRECVLRDSF